MAAVRPSPFASSAPTGDFDEHLVFDKLVSMPYDSAVHRITEDLAKVGFGVLPKIDVQVTMKKKLGHEMPPYRILGACNPDFARRAIAAEPQIGALLPCNVVVRKDAAGGVHIEVMDPSVILTLVNYPDIGPRAGEVRQKLERALARQAAHLGRWRLGRITPSNDGAVRCGGAGDACQQAGPHRRHQHCQR